jgi:tight adherence protein B
MSLLAAVAVVSAALLAAPPSSRHRLARLVAAERVRRTWRGVPWLVAGAWVVAVSSVGLAFFGTVGGAVGLCSALVTVTVAWLWRSHRIAGRAQGRTEEVVDGCQLLAGLLRVGHVPTMALRIAATDSAVFAEAAAAQRVGGSVVATLRRQAREPGGRGLAELATAWEVAESTGASMTATLDALSERLDAARKVARVVDAELAAPRATGRLLAALPVFGLLLGYAIGGDPGAFLLASPVGQLCLVIGVSLACAGVWWIEHIASGAGG